MPVNGDILSCIIDGESKIETPSALIILTPILTADKLIPGLTDKDLLYAARFTDTRRKASWMSWRAAVRRELGDVDIEYDSVGAPFIAGSNIHIGVSHTNSVASVILSRQQCAIDIEDSRRDFSKASSRFISADESKLQEVPGENMAGVIWCAKETLYKFSGRKELSLLNDLRIASINPGSATIIGAVKEEGGWNDYQLDFAMNENMILVWMTSSLA